MHHRRDGERTVRAFLQPVTERDETGPDSDVTSIGWVDGRLWLYLGQTAAGGGGRCWRWEGTTLPGAQLPALLHR